MYCISLFLMILYRQGKGDTNEEVKKLKVKVRAKLKWCKYIHVESLCGSYDRPTKVPP